MFWSINDLLIIIVQKEDTTMKLQLSFTFVLLLFYMTSADMLEDIQNDLQKNKEVRSHFRLNTCACSLSSRLVNFQKWIVGFNKTDSAINHSLMARYQTMIDTSFSLIDTSNIIFEGNKSAPVWIVAYVSVSCPLCKKLYNELYYAVTKGPLAGKARLGIKPFPANKLNTALAALRYWHKQSSLMLSLTSINERITMDHILSFVDSNGISRDEFLKKCESEEIISYTESSYHEAIGNGVSVTPTFFINGHPYRSFKDSQWVIDAVEFRYLCLKK